MVRARTQRAQRSAPHCPGRKAVPSAQYDHPTYRQGPGLRPHSPQRGPHRLSTDPAQEQLQVLPHGPLLAIYPPKHQMSWEPFEGKTSPSSSLGPQGMGRGELHAMGTELHSPCGQKTARVRPAHRAQWPGEGSQQGLWLLQGPHPQLQTLPQSLIKDFSSHLFKCLIKTWNKNENPKALPQRKDSVSCPGEKHNRNAAPGETKRAARC